MSEDAHIARIAAVLGQGGARVGIGDDAAVLDPPSEPLVWTVDEQVEDVHFERAWCSLRDVGYRATMAAASDLAAMGARPIGALAAIVAPPGMADSDMDDIARGQREACDVIGASIVGGNLSRGEKVSITTTWLGSAARPVLRRGARPGDGLYVCGDLGLAGAGFRALEAKMDTAPAEALLAWRRPTARIRQGEHMARVATAAIDVSDGLARDAGHIAAASDARIIIDEPALRAVLHPATVAVAQALGLDALDLALGGGEDYALLCTSSESVEGWARIGSVEPGHGVVLRSAQGDRPITAGFDHF
jgi:thiamine-monophosphate kinase